MKPKPPRQLFSLRRLRAVGNGIGREFEVTLPAALRARARSS
jgi:hypothetical protein